MTKKMKKESGFTLVEMLIVVAIIAILIAVSIPMVTGALDRAKEATDAANARAAKAQMTIAYLSEDADAIGGEVKAYDAYTGKLADDATKYGKAKGNTENIVWVVVYDSTVCYQWAASGTAPAKPTAVPNDTADGKGTWATAIPDISTGS